MKQTRFIPNDLCGLQVREAEDGQQSRKVVGRPIMFGVRSVNLTPWSETRVVYEILEPGCITQELLDRSDVVYNNNHSNLIADMLGRCRNGKGTLSLALRDSYIESECDYPNTTTANDTLEQIRLGNVYGMSFAFEDYWQDTENGVSYERTNETVDGKEVWLRHVKKIVALYDVANVTHPAYEQTSVGTREASERIDAAIEAQIKRECGDDEDAKRKAEEEAKAEEERKAADEKAKAEAEAKAKEEEERQLAEQEQRWREQRAMQLRARRMRTEQELESLIY